MSKEIKGKSNTPPAHKWILETLSEENSTDWRAHSDCNVIKHMQVNNKLCMHTYQSCYRENYWIEFVVKSSKINNIMYIKLKLYHPYFCMSPKNNFSSTFVHI